MHYLVTGATGFIGRHLVERLVDIGHRVTALVRDPARATVLPADTHLAVGDITDKASLREPMAGVDGVFHLAAWYKVGVDDVATAEAVNVEGTRNVLEVMAELDIDRGVYTSSLAVFSNTHGEVVDESFRYDGPHLSLYDRTKWEAHYEVAEPMIDDGLPLIIVQPGAVYGPGDRGPTWLLWEAYLQQRLSVIPGENGFCWGHVEDTVSGIISAMEQGTPGQTYIIAGEPYTLADVFELAASLTGIDPPRTVSPAIFRVLARVIAPIERLYQPPPQYTSEALGLLGGVTYWGDNTKATQALSLDHRPLREGLAETLEYEMDAMEMNNS